MRDEEDERKQEGAEGHRRKEMRKEEGGRRRGERREAAGRSRGEEIFNHDEER